MTSLKRDELGVIKHAREAAQDHGARRFIRNNADADVLGDCGLVAVREVLDHLHDVCRTAGTVQEVAAVIGDLYWEALA